MAKNAIQRHYKTNSLKLGTIRYWSTLLMDHTSQDYEFNTDRVRLKINSTNTYFKLSHPISVEFVILAEQYGMVPEQG